MANDQDNFSSSSNYSKQNELTNLRLDAVYLATIGNKIILKK